jgi:putative transposase
VKAQSFVRAGKAAGHGAARACRLLKVSRAAYYQRRHGTPSARRTAGAALPAEARRRSANRLPSEASH